MTISWPEKNIIVIPYSAKSIVVENNPYELARKPTLLLEINVFIFSNSIKCTHKNLEDLFKKYKGIQYIFLVNEGDIDKMTSFLKLLGFLFGFKKDTKKDLPNLQKTEKSVEDYNSNICLDSDKILVVLHKVVLYN